MSVMDCIRWLFRKNKSGAHVDKGYWYYMKHFKKNGDSEKWIAELWKTDTQEWPRIYRELNHREFPKELAAVKPDFYDGGEDDGKKLAFFSIIAEHITSTVGEFKVSQYHNCISRTGEGKMTKEAHLEWFLSHKVIVK